MIAMNVMVFIVMFVVVWGGWRMKTASIVVGDDVVIFVVVKIL